MALPNNEYAIKQFLARADVIDTYFKEFQNLTSFNRFMGPSNKDVIVTHKVTKGNVTQLRMKQTFYDINKKTLGETLLGNEQRLTYSTMSFSVAPQRYSMGMDDKEFNTLVFDIPFLEHMMEDLHSQAEKDLNDRIIQSFAQSFVFKSTSDEIASNSGDINPYVNKVYEWSDLRANMLLCGINTPNIAGDAMSHQRTMFGVDANNLPATGAARQATVAAATNLCSVANGHGFSLAHIRKAVHLAKRGNRKQLSPFKENPILSYTTDAGRKGFSSSTYLMLISQLAYEYIVDTPEWQAQVSRGMVERETQPSILWESAYKGTIEGAMIVVVPEFDDYVFSGAGAGGADIAYSVLLGGGALVYGTAGKPELRYDNLDFQNYHAIAHLETCGIRPIKFDSKSDGTLKGKNPLKVDNGMLHCFAAIS